MVVKSELITTVGGAVLKLSTEKNRRASKKKYDKY